jgi:tetratricopeptide (TPR) repeat protein
MLMLVMALAGCDRGADQAQLQSKSSVAATAKAEAPPYLPQQDPARLELEKFNDMYSTITNTADGLKEVDQFIQTMREKYPQSPYPYIAAASYHATLYASGVRSSPQEISMLLQKAFAISKDIPDAYVVSGELALSQNQQEAAQSQAMAAQKLAPEKPEVLALLGRAAAANGQFDDAEKHFKRYIEVSGKPARISNIYSLLGAMYTKKTPPELDNAEAAYAEAVKLNPNIAAKYFTLGKFLLTQRGDYESANVRFQEASALWDEPITKKWMTYSQYVKWADFYLNKGAHFKQVDAKSSKLSNPRLTDLKKISEIGGISPQDFFVEAASYPGLVYVLAGFLKSKVVTNIDYMTTGSFGGTALTRAARGGNIQAIRFLVTAGANVDSVDVSGNTALGILSYNGNWEGVKFVLDKGARVDMVNPDGRTPFELAYWSNPAKSQEGLKLFLEKKVNIDSPVIAHQSLLHSAVLNGDANMVTFALDNGANPNQSTNPADPGSRILNEALQSGNFKIVSALLVAGADPWQVHPGMLELTKKTGKAGLYDAVIKARESKPAPQAAAANSGAASK